MTCYNCKYCIKKRNNYHCEWKKCNMGKEPFYNTNKKFKRRKIKNLGFVVCSFKKR